MSVKINKKPRASFSNTSLGSKPAIYYLKLAENINVLTFLWLNYYMYFSSLPMYL